MYGHVTKPPYTFPKPGVGRVGEWKIEGRNWLYTVEAIPSPNNTHCMSLKVILL